MTHDQYANLIAVASVDDRVWKVGKRVASTTTVGWRPKPGMLLQQTCDPLEFDDESSGQADAGFPFVETNRLCQVVSRRPMN